MKKKKISINLQDILQDILLCIMKSHILLFFSPLLILVACLTHFNI